MITTQVKGTRPGNDGTLTACVIMTFLGVMIAEEGGDCNNGQNCSTSNYFVQTSW